MIKIPKDLQSMISASYHVNSFKRVVEELVYNSLDADSTSIAIRVNIQKNSIQVIDNGIGIKQNDFILLGQRYTTSKFDNISVVKSTPHTYGFRGLSLASIIDISSVVKIVSRFMNSKDTLSKIFNKGESEEIVKTDSRPSKGTTVEIYGLLCNLKIQKKALEQCNELFAIKILLEQLSLMHVNISFSLRDDGKNEIIFKIQKNRNVFQTISSLFSISPQELLEITAEKYHYKVKAFIEKRDGSLKKTHWLFLNGKYISKTKVHKIVNKLFLKSCPPRRHYKKNKQEDDLGNQALPTYFLFISCPYSDYDVLYSNSNKTLVEFKNWEPITNLIQRLVQCYTGDIKLKEITKPKNIHTQENKERNTRDQIKNIIDKFLAKNCKKQNIKMCNGIKGKEIKRIRQQNVPKNKFKINMNKTNQSKISHNKHSFLENCNSKRKRKLKTYNDNSIEDKTAKLNIKNYKSNSERITLNNNKFLKTLKETKFPHKFKNADDSNHLNESHAYITPDRRPHEAVNLTIEKPPEFKLNPVKDDVHNGVKEFDIDMHPKHLLKEICKRTDLPKTTEKTVMTTYDLVQTVTNNYKKTSNFIVSNKVSNNFISNKIYVPEYKMFVNNSGGFNKRLFSNKLTFESHHYAINRKKESHARFNRDKRILNSRENENYNIKNKVHTSIKKPPKKYSKQCVINKIKNGMEKSLYTIQDDYSVPKNSKKTSGNLYSKFMDLSFDKCNTFVNSMFENNFISGYVDKRYEKDRISTNLDGNNVLGNFNEYRVTYSIKSSRIYTEVSEMVNDNENNNCQNIVYNDFGPTYTKNTEVFHHSMVNKDVSEFQRAHSSISEVDPIELCEITFEHNSIKEKMNMNKIAVEPNANTTNNDYSTNNAMDPSEKVISHHFHTDEINEIILDTFNSSKKQTANTIDVSRNCNPLKSLTDFNMQSRYTFVPKGMSPIFTNCNFKPTHSGLINLNDEYYKDVIYEKFAEKVLESVHIFEPSVQNINVAVTYDGLKNNKMIKDNANLMFNGESIKNAKVLAQIDCKFIVTILPGKTISKNVDSNYLVLFDQHAVHERIRLETNLKDYFNGLAWKCVNTDAISLKLPKDDAALIHNHKDKLCTFGLQWSVEDSNISVYAIPEAILGKNPRPADVVLKATKRLLSELIDALKNLKGNIPLYPQSIMNLVFSEACRYAIMFGDKLSKSECVDLIHSLSECKTPFQCAHGRPVMTVVMELIEGEPKYMVNTEKILEFKNKYYQIKNV